ncbi:MAG: citryl-CoA lyase [Candidatus Geothermarchaeales archaeon]
MNEKRYPWRTSIIKVEPGKMILRGYRIEDLIENLTFGEAVYLLFKGELPPKNHGKLIDAMLVMAIDYGVAAPSIATARIASSCGNSLTTSVVAGLCSFGGTYHGGAVEGCVKMLREGVQRMLTEGKTLSEMAEILVDEHRSSGRRVPGYGHPLHRETDPRVEKLFELAERYGVAGDHIALCRAVGEALDEAVGRHLTINPDAAVAALSLDMGFEWGLIQGFNLISRCAGLIAHAYEERSRERPFRTVGVDQILYDGPPERDFAEVSEG